mmetsp:Transcript_38888/g.77169  ORF Transcript_38888/g.77169 Transcript_38888/m.77169 type:complete len:230 (+) Transcript_38888:425-1114(+)
MCTVESSASGTSSSPAVSTASTTSLKQRKGTPTKVRLPADVSLLFPDPGAFAVQNGSAAVHRLGTTAASCTGGSAVAGNATIAGASASLLLPLGRSFRWQPSRSRLPGPAVSGDDRACTPRVPVSWPSGIPLPFSGSLPSTWGLSVSGGSCGTMHGVLDGPTPVPARKGGISPRSPAASRGREFNFAPPDTKAGPKVMENAWTVPVDDVSEVSIAPAIPYAQYEGAQTS